MTKAIFIGGPFDLTKRILTKTPKMVSFFEPLDRELITDHNIPESTVECRVLWYKFCYKTKQGVLIYEYSRQQ